VFQAIRDYPECQSLDGCQGLFPGAPVNRNPWKRGDIGDPASIRLPVELDVKIEGRRSS
jgi:hypothetical protein